MFGIEWSEYVLIGVVALIVIGPKELPAVLRAVGQWTGKIRRMAAEFQSQFQEAMREAEMADLKKEVDNLTSGYNSLGDPETTKWDPETVARMNEETRKSAETDAALAVFSGDAPAQVPAPAAALAPDGTVVNPGGNAPAPSDVHAPQAAPGVVPQPVAASAASVVSPPPAATAAASATPAQSPATAVPAASPAPAAPPSGSAATSAAGVAGVGAPPAEIGALHGDRLHSSVAAATVAEESSHA
jgi:sec-independent protein translocase protein TatB